MKNINFLVTCYENSKLTHQIRFESGNDTIRYIREKGGHVKDKNFFDNKNGLTIIYSGNKIFEVEIAEGENEFVSMHEYSTRHNISRNKLNKMIINNEIKTKEVKKGNTTYLYVENK